MPFALKTQADKFNPNKRINMADKFNPNKRINIAYL